MSRLFTVPAYILPSLNIPFFSSSSAPQASVPPSSESSSTTPAPSSSDAPPSTTSSPTTPSIARAAPDTLRCKSCSAQLAFTSQIMSRQFTGRLGRAVLVSPTTPRTNLPNVELRAPQDRILATGPHVVADIDCAVCNAALGWKYVDAGIRSQHYKIGCFILELGAVVEHRSWEDAEGVRAAVAAAEHIGTISNEPIANSSIATTTAGANVPTETSTEADMAAGKLIDDWVDVEFDSGDEFECRELFAGTWDAEKVAKRRELRNKNKSNKKDRKDKK